MKMKLYSTVFCLLAAGIVSAADVNVPNTFTSGAPARASEVNENFSTLESAVNDNAARLDAVEADTRGGFPPLVELNIPAVNAIPGDMVDLGGETGEIREHVFQRFDTDEEIVLEYPSKADDAVAVTIQLVRNLPLSQVGLPNGANTYSFSINGFDARLNQSYIEIYQTLPFGGETRSRNFTDSVSLLIGEETMLVLSYRDSDPLGVSSNKSDIQAYMDRRLAYLPYLELRPKN
jgi:hypothetical protein